MYNKQMFLDIKKRRHNADIYPGHWRFEMFEIHEK